MLFDAVFVADVDKLGVWVPVSCDAVAFRLSDGELLAEIESVADDVLLGQCVGLATARTMWHHSTLITNTHPSRPMSDVFDRLQHVTYTKQ